MAVMQFSKHPGELPFVTHRSEKWANRLAEQAGIDIEGIDGCELARQYVRVVAVELHPEGGVLVWLDRFDS